MEGSKKNGTDSGEPVVHFKPGDPELVRMSSMHSSPAHIVKSGCFNLPILFERAGSCFPTPRFDSEILESEQWKSYFPQTHRRFQYALMYVLVACVIWAIYFGIFNQSAHQWPYFLVGTIVLLVVIALVLGFTYSRHYKKLYLVTSVFVSVLVCVAVLLTLLYTESDLSTIGAFTASVEILLMIYSVIPLPLFVTMIIGVMYSVLFEAFTLMQNHHMQEPIFIVGKVLLHLCIHIMGVHIFTMRQVRQRSTFLKIGQSVIVRQDLEFEKQIKEKMIHSLMPPSVAAEVMKTRADKDDENAGNDIQARKNTSKGKSLRKGEIIFRTFNMNVMNNVSILFADIVGFTKMSSNKTAEQLVGLLNDLFGRFDELCVQTGCEKISTLGDCYYCVAGCPIPKADHAKCCVEMGLGMIEAIKQFDIDNNEEVNMRVGVHTGTVLCGIVGTRRFKFDVWSNDVFLANTMESTGEQGRVHISEASLVFLKDMYEVELGEECEDNRSERKLVEEYDTHTSQYAVKHAAWDKMIKTYFIVGHKKDGASKPDTDTPTVPEVQPDTVAISMEAENGPTESESLMNDTSREPHDANGIMTTLSSHLNNSLNNLDEKDLGKSPAPQPAKHCPPPTQSNNNGNVTRQSSSPLVDKKSSDCPTEPKSQSDNIVSIQNDPIPAVVANVTHIDETNPCSARNGLKEKNQKCTPDNIQTKCTTDNNQTKCTADNNQAKCTADNNQTKSTADNNQTKSTADNNQTKCIADNNQTKCTTDNNQTKCTADNNQTKCTTDNNQTKCTAADKNLNQYQPNEISILNYTKEAESGHVFDSSNQTLKDNVLDQTMEVSKWAEPVGNLQQRKHVGQIEQHISNPNGEVVIQNIDDKSYDLHLIDSEERLIDHHSTFYNDDNKPDAVGAQELDNKMGSPFLGRFNSSSRRRSIKSTNSPVYSNQGTPYLSRDVSRELTPTSSTYPSPALYQRQIKNNSSGDKSPKFYQQQFNSFFNPSPKTSPGDRKRIYVPLSKHEQKPTPAPSKNLPPPQAEGGPMSILSAVSAVGLSLLRLQLGDTSDVSGDLYDISLEPIDKTFSKIRNINHHTDVNKSMDMHIVKCIQEGIKDKEYLYRPPINQFTLAFTDKNLEENYRDHYLGEEHNLRTMSAPKYLSFLEIIVSFIVYIIVSIFCFVVFDKQLPWLIFFCVSLVLEILNIIRGYMTIKHSENTETGFWNSMISFTSGWYLRNFIGALIASLPLLAVFVNFSCHLMRSSEWTDRFFCFCIVVSLVHYTNFTTLSSWMKSIIVFLAGVVLIILITLVKCTTYVDMDMSTMSSVTVTQIVIANTSFPNVQDTTGDMNVTSKEYIPLFSGLHIVQAYTFFEIILDMLLLMFLIGFLNRESEISYRLNYHGDAQAWEYKQIMQENKDQADWLLHNIIPPHVSEVVRETSKYSKSHKDVGVIFAAIVNFNEIYDESYEGGREFLRVLNELVSDYEDLLDEERFKDVEKIKTISSTFMAASGLNEVSRKQNANSNSHLYALIEFSTELQNCIDRFNDSIFNFDFIMKIGFNFGEVVAGVIGTTKLLYDIWGDTVNISSRMYSTGVAEKIQVPEACALALGEKMVFEYRGEITVKGKGEMKTFLYVSTKDGEAYPWD